MALAGNPTTCGPQGCPVMPTPRGSLFPPVLGMFGSGLAFGGPLCTPMLPRIGCKQFNINAKLWKAKLNASTIRWGTNTIGGKGTDLDLHDDLGLEKRKYIPEYEARCQIRPNWGIRYSFMPISYRANTWQPFGFFFGNTFFVPGLPTLTRWDRNINRWDLVYDWYQGSYSMSSVFAGYALYDDKLVISNSVVSRNRSSGWGLVNAGLSLEKAVRVLGSGVASCNCKWSLQFGEGYFGWDGQAQLRIAVPMDCGRFGYIEAGWRWMALERDYPINCDKISLDGLTGTIGLVF